MQKIHQASPFKLLAVAHKPKSTSKATALCFVGDDGMYMSDMVTVAYSPTVMGFNASVDFALLRKAVDGKPDVRFKVSGSHIEVMQGKLKVKLARIFDEYLPVYALPAFRTPCDGKALKESLSKVADFVPDKASADWMYGVHFSKGAAYATSSTRGCCVHTGLNPDVTTTVPGDFIKALIKYDDTPIAIGVSERAFAVFYADGSWLCTLVIVGTFQTVDKLGTDTYANVPVEPLLDAYSELKRFISKGDHISFTQDSASVGSVNVSVGTGELNSVIDAEYLELTLGIKVESYGYNARVMRAQKQGINGTTDSFYQAIRIAD